GRISVQLRFQEEPPIYSVPAPCADDPYVMVRMLLWPLERMMMMSSIIMPPKGMSATAIQKLVTNKVAEALAVDRAARNDPNVAEGSGGNGG
nr:hypothetical protein [Tanacetum cinerariifolium]